ncbi:MAG: right-handed parallel beta-helix repeat-containing protein, partial [Verrucomicrobiales bacterium]
GRKQALAKDADADSNIDYCAADPGRGAVLLKKHRAEGVDEHSRSVDPLFVDPENGDFRFKPGSPALEMGIAPIDLSRIGLLDASEQP